MANIDNKTVYDITIFLKTPNSFFVKKISSAPDDQRYCNL